jgi:hypothetical protein
MTDGPVWVPPDLIPEDDVAAIGHAIEIKEC